MHLRPAILVVALLSLAPGARGQDWLLDDELRTFSAEAKDGLAREVQKAPERALQRLLDQETVHLEALTKPQLDAFAKDALTRLKAAREEGHLFREVKATLKRARVEGEALVRKVWAFERTRLDSLPDRAAFALVDTVLRRVVVERLSHLRDRRLTLWRTDGNLGSGAGPLPDAGTVREGDLSNWVHANRVMTNADPVFAWRERGGPEGLDVGTDLPLPDIRFWSESASLREVLYEREWAGSLGKLKVEAASVSGLANARAGRVALIDDLGREAKGYGATFSASARVTGVRADVTTRDLELSRDDFGFSARAMATLVDAAVNADAAGTALVTEHGVAARLDARAGAGVSASGRLPIKIDLKLLSIRVVPYASVHAGAMAEAHGTLEVSWTGTVRFDVGAAAAAGIGVGGGVIVEVELGPALKAAINRAIEAVVKAGRPLADALTGKTWKGPALESDKLTLTVQDLERSWIADAEAGVAPPPRPTTALEAAARFAPVVYQRVKSQHDLVRRVDFDGDWVMTNNWEHAGTGDLSACAYYDVKETATHWFVTYTFYWPRRESTAPLFLNALRRHENDLGGCVVVARKDAPRGHEVELLLTTDGDGFHAYGPPKGERWKKRDGRWHGELRFVDEADHPLVDLERTHPQVWIDPRDHDVRGFNGRDDARPFGSDEGVVYVPTGTAEVPDGTRDPHVGYALRPLPELLAHAGERDAFTTGDLVRPRGGRALPRRMRGEDGNDDEAVPPWAWGDPDHEFELDAHGERVRKDPARTILEGDLFADPARVTSILFETPAGFGRAYRAAARGEGLASQLP